MDHLNYNKMFNEAMIFLIKNILQNVYNYGLYDNHHLYITFDTTHENTLISSRVKEMYPEKITIILQHKFDNLVINEHDISVKVSFNNIPETITIPFKAILEVHDPSVNFSINLNPFEVNKKIIIKDFEKYLDKEFYEVEYYPSLDSKKTIIENVKDTYTKEAAKKPSKAISLSEYRNNKKKNNNQVDK